MTDTHCLADPTHIMLTSTQMDGTIAISALTTSLQPTGPLLLPMPERDSREIVFIDPGVPDYQTLLNGIKQGASVVILDANRDGVEQIAQILVQCANERNGEQWDAVHIVCHGEAGRVFLGSSTLSNNTLSHHTESLQQWGNALTSEGDLLFYGCNTGANAEGSAWVEQIAQLTAADVAASEDPTGALQKGGDWELERTAGAIQTSIAFNDLAQKIFDGTLGPTASSGTLTISPILTGSGLSVAPDKSIVNEGSNTTFTLSLGAASSSVVQVNYATVADSATANSDFTSTAGTVTFQPGETQKNIVVPILDDNVDEKAETFKFLLSSSVNASLDMSTASVTINDNDFDLENGKKHLMTTYLPWYEDAPTWSHWKWDHPTLPDRDPDQGTHAAVHKPLIGLYDSADRAVIRNHLLQMKVAGSDLVATNWYGQGQVATDQATLALKAVLDEVPDEFGYTLMLDGEQYRQDLNLTTRKAAFFGDMEYMADNYLTDSHYARFNNNPVVIYFRKDDISGQPAIADGWLQEVNDHLLATRGITVAFMPHDMGSGSIYLDESKGSFAWSVLDLNNAPNLSNWFLPHQQWLRNGAVTGNDFFVIPSIFTGFDDLGVYAWNDASNLGSNQRYYPRSINGVSTLSSTYQLVKNFRNTQGNLPITVMNVGSFNDWNEGTEYEASAELGLTAIRELSAISIDFGVNFTPLTTTQWTAVESYLNSYVSINTAVRATLENKFLQGDLDGFTGTLSVSSGTLSASDSEGRTLTYSIVSNGTLGMATIINSHTGTYIYVPNKNAIGTDTFTFMVNNGTTNSNTASVTVTISGTSSADVNNLTISELNDLTSKNLADFSVGQLDGLTSTQLASLANTQLDGLTSLQLFCLAATQLNGLGSDQLFALSDTQLNGLVSTQMAGLGNTQMDGLRSTQITGFANTQLNGLLSIQLAAFSNTQLNGLSSEQLMALANTQLDGLASEQLTEVANTQLDGLTSTQLAGLIGTQLDGLASSQLAVFANSKLDGMTSSGFSGLANTQLDSLTSSQWMGLANTQLDGLGSAQLFAVLDTQLDGLTSAQLAAFANSQLDGLASVQLPGLSDTQLNGLASGQLSGLSDTQLNGLMSTQLVSLADTQLDGLHSTQITGLANTQLDLLKSAQLVGMANTQLYGVRSAQLMEMADTQLDGLRSLQLFALTDTQLNGLASLQLAGLADTQLDGLTAKQLVGLTNTQLDGLSSTQLASLAGTQLDGLHSVQLNKLADTQLNGVTSRQFTALANTQLDGLRSGQLAGLADTRLNGLTSLQLVGVANTQLDGISSAQLAGLANTQL
ncbi:MAG: DUF4347 domain-containing protein, partial [Magnetococcales bacterium]|nr:DUF4347 domain-containing protein [Magnetococcales bacterium]